MARGLRRKMMPLMGRAYYAARSAASEQGRFLFGWVPHTRRGKRYGKLALGRHSRRTGGCISVRTEPWALRRLTRSVAFLVSPQSTQIGRIFNQDGVAELDVADEIGDTFLL